MWHKYVEPVLQWLYHVIREPRSELDRWQRAVRFAYDLGRYGARQLREDRAPQMAAALAYQALFALVPVLVVATIIMRALKPEKIAEVMHDLLESAGLSEVGMPLPAENGTPAQTITAREWLDGLIEKAASIDLEAVGWIGFGVIVYAAISMLVTIENSFNIIYRAPEGRPWSRRVPLYWFLLTVGPLAVVLTSVLDSRVHTLLTALQWSEFAVGLGTTVWSASIGWLFWFAVYTFVPNTSINLRASAAGALVAVLLIETGKAFLGAYVSNTLTVSELNPLSTSQVFGSLALIPVFMFWVYLMWLVILFGLEVSATLQFLGDHAVREMESRRENTGLIEPSIVVSAMQVVGEGFASGRPTSQRMLADRVGVAEKLIAPIVQELCRAGYLHRLDGEDKSVCLTRPPDQIQTADLMDVGFRLADSSRESNLTAFVDQLRDAQRERAADVALQEIIPPPPPTNPARVPT